MRINKNNGVLGLIVARKGSKGLKNKNLLKFNKKTLIDWTITEAKKSKLLNYILLSTDSEEIASIGRHRNISVPFLRPKNLSTDKVKIIDVILHSINFLKKKKYFF